MKSFKVFKVSIEHCIICCVLVVVSTLSVAAQTVTQAPTCSDLKPAIANVVANVGGKEITVAELEANLGAQAAQLEEQIYQFKRHRLNEMVAERLIADEAARRKMPVEALLNAEVTAKVAPVTEGEIEAFFQGNAQLRNSDPAVVRPQIKNYLANQRTAAAREIFVQSLRAKASVVINLPPPRLRIHASIADAPFKGGANAAVTIIEFSDFHCQFCIRVQPTLAQVVAKYGDQVKLVYRDLPLDQLHPQARRAAEAARCAMDQGKFWPFHDQLYQGGADASIERFKSIAQTVGLDADAFESCLSGGKHKAEVQQSIDEATKLGLSGTPAFLINGRFLSGAQPLEAFVALIEEELALARSGSGLAKTQQSAK